MDERIEFEPVLPPMAIPRIRRRRPEEKGRDPYDGLRPWSAITHGLGIALGLLGAALLLLRAWAEGPVWHLVPFSVYAISMIGLYTASTLYHCLRTGVAGRVALRKYDHISIYFLIAGSYTPVCLVALPGLAGRVLCAVVWSLTLAGTVLALVWINAPRWMTSGIYLFMGWLALIMIVPLSRSLPGSGMFWLVLGGLLYTIGGVLYAVKWPGRHNPRFGCHEIFHVFILLGSVAHFLLMYRVIAFM
ncbi:MAG: hemolysin III family protein [Intestinimonas sp.]|nr:hemolysin III family protein [Intestinimonas sp.]